MPIYASYLRVSSEEQRERQSIKTQLEVLNNYARTNNIRLRHVFADDGISGSVPVSNRPDGARLITEAEARTFDTLLVFRLDRLARDTLELLRVIKHLEQHGVTVKSITEPFETSDPVGRMVITMLGGMAQLEKDSFKERSYHGMRRAAREGKWTGGRAPFGYRVENQKLVINEVEAEIVREIFEKYAAGGKSMKIAEALNARGVPVPAAWRGIKRAVGAKWVDTSVQKLLRNETYTGRWQWNKWRTVTKEGRRAGAVAHGEDERVTIRVPAIISDELFHAAQRRLRENLRFSRRNSHRVFVLRRLVRCGVGGLSCDGVGGDRWPAYSCQSRRRRVFSEATGCPHMDANELEQAVWHDLVELSADPTRVIEALREEHEARRGSGEMQRREERLSAMLESKATERQKILRLLRADRISEAEAEEQLAEIERERDALGGELVDVPAALRSAERFEQSIGDIQDALKRLKRNAKKASPEQRAELIRSVVSKITVHHDLRTEVEYNVLL